VRPISSHQEIAFADLEEWRMELRRFCQRLRCELSNVANPDDQPITPMATRDFDNTTENRYSDDAFNDAEKRLRSIRERLGGLVALRDSDGHGVRHTNGTEQ
jgi:hypothetical protein